MYSNEYFMFHRIYERIKSSAVPLILSFIGLSLFYFMLRKFVTNVGTFWSFTDFIAAVIIIGIIAFFKRFLNENQQLRNEITEKNATIKERDLNIKESKMNIKELERKLEISNEQFKNSIRYNRQNSKNIKIQTLKENEKLQNQILKNLEIIDELTIQNKSMKEELFASNKLSEERRKLLLIKEKEIKENMKNKTEENQQKVFKENEQLRNQISIMDSDFQQSTMKMVLLKKQLENELLIKDEKNHEIIKELSKETERIRKNLSNQEIMIFETNKEIKELEKTILKFKNEQKFHQNETLQMKKRIQNQSTKYVQTSPENFVVSKKCQKQKKFENGEKETELNHKSDTEISNVINNILLPSQSILAETDDDLPPPPSLITTAKFLDQTSSLSKFTSSTPMSFKSSTVFEPNVKMPPPIAPKPKYVPSSPAPSNVPPPPPSIECFNKSFPSNQSPSSSSNITPKRTFQSIHRILSADLQAEIQTPRKLKCVKKEIEERRKAKFQNEKNNEFPDFKTLLSQRANKVNTNISFEDEENDSDGEEWK
uniref:Uncharacterized protein n=1 Tax=Panagrolaimus davidi TaxID=227884 RepID=A0A914R6T9_9BILA